MINITNRFSSISISSLLLLTALVSCGPQQETANPTDEPAAQTEISEDSTADSSDIANAEKDGSNNTAKAPTDKPADQSASQPIFPALDPGDYCYTTKTETNTLYARINIAPSDRVTGNLQGTVHDEANAYYTSYNQTLDGTIDGSNLNLDVATWIEYDKQNKQEVWKVSDSTLTLNNETLGTESCDTVNKVFQNEAGLEAKDLTINANQVHTQQVFFDPVSTSTTVSKAVVRGDRDLYQLTAQGGQEMKLSISSLENNAVFDVVSPSGIILGTELTEESIFLPHTGDYEIIVGGTRGNATYDLSIEIQ